MQKPLDVIRNCRVKISAIDEQIFKLIKEREKIASLIGGQKRLLNIDDKDYKREEEVFDKAVKKAKELSLPEELVLSLQKTLMEISIKRQQEDRIKSYQEKTFCIGVVGGSGRIGKWLCNFFLECGHNVYVVDKVKPDFDCHYEKNIDLVIPLVDIIVIAAPIRATKEILESFLQKDLKQIYIFDVSSTKALVKEPLYKLKQKGVHVTSIHPMFGPSVEYLFGKHIIVTSLNDNKADELAKSLFQSTSVNLVDMSFDEHDEIVSYLLSLAHLINILFILTLTKSSFTLDFLENLSSTTFKKQLDIAKNVFLENPHLYFEIQSLNPHNRKVYEKMTEILKKLTDEIITHDENNFVENMNKGKSYIFSDQK